MDDPMGKVPGMHLFDFKPGSGSSDICKVVIWL